MANLKLSRQADNLEKLIAYIMGVAPWEFGLIENDGGWLPMKDLVAAIHSQDGFRGVTEGRILELHRQPGGASPLEIEGRLVRLKPGRGPVPDPGEAPAAKPKILHLALKPSLWRHAAERGIFPRPGDEEGAKEIALFEDKEAALATARRIFPNAVAVSLNAKMADSGGARLTYRGPGLWSAGALKAEWLSGPPTPPKAEGEPSKQATKPETPLPGAPIWAEPRVSSSKGKKRGKYEDAPEWKTRTRLDRRKDKG